MPLCCVPKGRQYWGPGQQSRDENRARWLPPPWARLQGGREGAMALSVEAVPLPVTYVAGRGVSTKIRATGRLEKGWHSQSKF